MRPLSYEESIRILLNGVTGVNSQAVSDEIGIARLSVSQFAGGSVKSTEKTRDLIAAFVWRRMNAHVLLSDSDRA